MKFTEYARLPYDLNRFAIRLARDAPQLVPAFIWLLLISSHGRPTLRQMKNDRPPPAEIKALVELGGDKIRRVLDLTGGGQRAAKEAEAMEEDPDLIEVRWHAAKRFGFGIESLVDRW